MEKYAITPGDFLKNAGIEIYTGLRKGAGRC